MGNRGGMFHDPLTRTLGGRRWASRRWLCCSLDYPGRRRHPVWSRGYTQLFFLDEVTALAAGHRPCFECRRAEARAFQRALAEGDDVPTLPEIDLRLHGERLDGRRQRRHGQALGSLPDGAMFAVGDRLYAVRGGAILLWVSTGYRRAEPRPAGTVEALTPPTTLVALRAGYRPLWHPTAKGKQAPR